jgi:serine/threonine protein kinase
MAPEALTHCKITKESDVWSYGILLWEIYTYGCTPYPSVPPEQTLTLITNGYRLEKPDDCLIEIYQLMLSCWIMNIDERPKFYELVKTLEDVFHLTNNFNMDEVNPACLVNPLVSLNSTNNDLGSEAYKLNIQYSQSIQNSSACTSSIMSSSSCCYEESDFDNNNKVLVISNDEDDYFNDIDNKILKRNSILDVNEEFKPFLNQYYNKNINDKYSWANKLADISKQKL